MALKERISSPLEAGPSILDAHHLPPQLIPALEYTSSRLARKSLHLTLVVVRRDYQLPAAIPSYASPASAGFSTTTPTTPASPPPSASSFSSRFSFTSGPVTVLKQLVRSASQHAAASHSPRSVESPAPSMSAVSSPGFMSTAFDLPSPRLRWPLSPPMTPMTPMTPYTSSSVTTTDTSGGSFTPNFTNIQFLHNSNLPQKTEKILKSTLGRAGSKYNLGNGWLSPPVSPAACGLPTQLFHSSVIQNEVLFSSEGLTLVSLDRLYSLKSALSSYSKTGSPLRLEDAVDELRRFVLAGNGSKVTKADLLRSYDWLSVSKSAIADLDHMYRRAYGGPENIGAISGMFAAMKTPKPLTCAEPYIRHDDFAEEDYNTSFYDPMLGEDLIGVAVTAVQVCKPSSPPRLAPLLKLQTNFEVKPTKIKDTKGLEAGRAERGGDHEEEDEERTARPTDQSPAALHPWNTHSTIDQVLSAGIMSPERSSMVFGPLTPNVYDDISPITRGEWGFLVDKGLHGGRTVAVETF